MLQLTAARSQIELALPWLDGLRRFEQAQGVLPPSFGRRRDLILLIACAVLLFSSAGWGGYFWLIGMGIPARVNLFGSLLGAAGLGLLWLRLPRSAALLFIATGLMVVGVLAVMADIPDVAVPRTLHLLLIPMAIAAVFLTQHETPGLRLGLPILIFAAFCAISGLPPSGEVSMMSLAQRQSGAAINAVLTSALVYVLLLIMLREAREKSAMERDFARALASRQLQVFLQAQCTADGRIVGAEALMRWQHPRRGFVSPAEFVPVAEASGLIVPAGEFVLAEVCQMLERWQSDPALREIAVAVNVSPAQLFSGETTRRLQDLVPAPLAEARLVKFELTESLFVHDFDAVQSLIQGIRSQGIRISLDDFGTGYSSLSYLKKLPLDQLKVDQSFVRDMPQDDGACKIARTIVQLGSDLDLEVIAEGVETAEQVAALTAMGCRMFQGYLFARPVPVEAFEALVRERAVALAA